MIVYKYTTAWDFLHNESWCCENLKDAISNALLDSERKSSELEQKLNAYVDEVFYNEHDVSQTQLNDFLRFYSDDILKAIGLEEYI